MKDTLNCQTNSPCQHLKNVWQTLRRISTLMLGYKGLLKSTTKAVVSLFIMENKLLTEFNCVDQCWEPKKAKVTRSFDRISVVVY